MYTMKCDSCHMVWLDYAWMTEEWGFDPWLGQVISSSPVSRLALRPTQASYRTGMEGSSLGIKQLGCEADYYSLSSTRAKNAWSYTSTPPQVFIGWSLMKYRVKTYTALRILLTVLIMRKQVDACLEKYLSFLLREDAKYIVKDQLKI